MLPVITQDVGEYRTRAKQRVFKQDGQKDDKYSDAGKPSEDCAEFLLGGFVFPFKGDVEPSANGTFAVLNTAIGRRDGDVAPSCREIVFALRTFFFASYSVERQQRVDEDKAYSGDDSGCDGERNALVHKRVFGCRDVNVIVASLQAGGVEFWLSM